MAAVTYTVKRGDSLWAICASSENGPKISGNGILAKIDTLRSLNGIPANSSLIHPGQVLTLSISGGEASASSSSTNELPWDRVVIDVLALKSDSSTGRDVYAHWAWRRINDHTRGYKIQWEYDTVIDGRTVTQYAVNETNTPGDTFAEFTVPEAARPYNNWVQVFVTPISETYKPNNSDDEVPYWSGVVAVGKQYYFKDNPPFTPSKPTCEIDNTTLTMKIDEIKKEIDAASIIFQVVKDNTSVIYNSSAIPVTMVTDDYGKVSHQYAVQLGSSYKVRARSVASNGKQSAWSEFSDAVETKPSSPTIIECKRNKRSDGSISAYIEWTAVPNASRYKVLYATAQEDFDTPTGDVDDAETSDARTSLEISGVTLGESYYFRVVAINKKEIESDPSEIVSVPIGEPPTSPITWSSSESAFEGELLELNWQHNAVDKSNQTYAEVAIKVGDNDWVSYIYKNTTDDTTGDRKDIDTSWSYGKCVSYKGVMYFKMDTSRSDIINKKIQWKVQTAGITGEFGNSDDSWSVVRPVYVYEKPTLEMSMTKDASGETGLITSLDSFPFYINCKAVFEHLDYDIQRPVGYHVRIVTNDYYVTADDTGSTKNINKGDAVYAKYFSTTDALSEEISADDVDLESGINYTLYCTIDMSTGLTITAFHDFYVSWVESSYRINVDVNVDKSAYTALISPYCTDIETGALVNNVSLSVYRREYNGSYTKIASGVPNYNTSVTDPHPALDYARYRIVAKDTTTGAISFYDAPGYPVNGTSIIIQWDEEWSTFDTSDETSADGPTWSGSFLELPYNIQVADSRSREVEIVRYAGREYPVAYYGTQLNESPSWKCEIPKSDKDTLYALRRLSIWSGDVYIREPSGMGYWANIQVSFDQKYKETATSVTINITRVEGGA